MSPLYGYRAGAQSLPEAPTTETFKVVSKWLVTVDQHLWTMTDAGQSRFLPLNHAVPACSPKHCRVHSADLAYVRSYPSAKQARELWVGFLVV